MHPAIIEPSADLDELAHRVIGAAIEVHRALGPGFLEAVYEEALVLELKARKIPCERQIPVAVVYKGRSVGESRIDLIVDRRLVVELKATDAIAPIHLAQTLSYLKATGLHLGLVITFNVTILGRGVRRVVWSGGPQRNRQDAKTRRYAPGIEPPRRQDAEIRAIWTVAHRLADERSRRSICNRSTKPTDAHVPKAFQAGSEAFAVS